MTDDPRPISESAEEFRARLEIVRQEAPSDARSPEEWDAEHHGAEAEERWDKRMPKRFRDARVDALDAGVRAEIEEWVGLDPLPNLVLVGPVGVGKTFAGAAALRLAHEAGRRFRFTSASALLADTRPGGDKGAYERALGVDVLFLDDVGAGQQTEWTDDHLGRLLDVRWNEERPIVATSNLSIPGLREHLGERAYERLCLSGAVLLEIQGESRRRDR